MFLDNRIAFVKNQVLLIYRPLTRFDRSAAVRYTEKLNHGIGISESLIFGRGVYFEF